MATRMSKEIMKMRVALIGKTGGGKSSLGNTLLGKPAFLAKFSMASTTQKCGWSYGTCHGIDLEVTDTPGLCDTDRPPDVVMKEITKSVSVSTPGPHVMLLVLRCDVKFTKEEYNAYLDLQKIFGEHLTRFLIIIFTRADEFGDTYEARMDSFRRDLPTYPDNVKKILEDAGQRYCLINNKDPKDMRDSHTRDLIKMMLDLVTKNEPRGESYFTCKMFQELTLYVNEEIEQRMESHKQTREEADVHVREDIINDAVDRSFFTKAGAVVGGAVGGVVGSIAGPAGFVAGAGAGACIGAGVGSKCVVM
ncbi:GTPase IMAP family member 4-like isoform X2 [Babylonia areolata]|uniref:GTPase IMAP family member 4-like isoform X2 n=2 Tax=Babylonia areolata TaxID=304850 RepID=UPI003FCFEC93